MKEVFEKLGISDVNSGAYCGEWLDTSGEIIEVFSPIDDSLLTKVRSASEEDYEIISQKAQEAFKIWRMIPAPKRGEIVRQIGLELRKHKDTLGQLVTIEMGKILTEGLGEVQEMIDMADFAVGLSRQLYGLTMMSERPSHRMYEQWHPLGVIGIISAFIICNIFTVLTYVLISNNNPIIGSLFGMGTLTALVGTFVHGTKIRKGSTKIEIPEE